MSLRARLLLGMGLVAVVLVITSLSITRATRGNLVHQVDQQLERANPGRGMDLDGDRDEPSRPAGPANSLYVAVVDPQTGQLRTIYVPNTTEESPSAPDLDASEVAEHLGTGPFTVSAEDSDLRYRAIVRTTGRDQVAYVMALPLEDVDESIERLIVIQGLAAVVILTTLGLVTFWVLRLGVRPVQEMTATAKAIGEGDLSQRIPESAPGTEAGELGVALNQMLGRIETAFDQQAQTEARLRQFVADASHELRTPVTTIRGYAELYRLGGLTDDHDLSEAMRRTEQEATRMGQLVADLLDLARLDRGRPLNLGPVDLTQLAADAVADTKAVEPDRPVVLDAPDPAVIVGDEAYLRQILANLVTNARVHSDPDVAIAVRVRNEPSTVVIEVADQGPGMEPEVAAHAFERFYRADPARTRHRGGSGLGLSIVAATVEAHGGTIELDTEVGRGTTVRVLLPKAPAAPSA